MRLDDKLEDLRNSLPEETKRVVNLAAEKGASSWLTVIPVKEMDLNLNKREFKDAVHLRYDWQISDLPNVYVFGEPFNVDHAMICRQGGFTIRRHNELRNLEAQMLNLVCHDAEIEPVLQITGASLARGANTAPDARLDIHARSVWSRQGLDVDVDVLVCHPNAESYKDLTPQQIYRQHENEKKGM